MRDADDVTTIELKVAESTVGRLRMRASERPTDASLLRLVTTLIASEVERVRAPERASEEAATAFMRAVLERRIEDREDLIARGKELGTDLGAGASVVIIRAHPRNPTEEDWRRRLLALAARAARSIAPGAIAAPTVDEAAEIAVLLPDGDGEVARRTVSGDPARARVGAARVRVRDRAEPAHRRSARAAPRAQRGAARGQRRRGRARAR